MYAISIVVDNAIVVIEAVHAKMETKNLDPLHATEEAMYEISGQLLPSLFVMAAVFIPWAFMRPWGILSAVFHHYGNIHCIVF